MSPPTTPARSIARSLLSTPSTGQHGVSPQELTPTSKIKAMLRAIDQDSDSELTSNTKNHIRAPLSTVTGNERKLGAWEAPVPKDTLALSRGENGDDEQEEDEEPSFVPRGRLAARLQGQAEIRQDSGSSKERITEENAYARTKRRLPSNEKAWGGKEKHFSKHLSSQRESPMTSTMGWQNTAEIHSDHERLPSISPAKSRTSSPGLFLTPEGPPRSHEPSHKPRSKEHSDSDSPAGPSHNSRFLELVARKRAEREAKQAAENKKRKGKASKRRLFEKQLSGDASSVSEQSDEDRTADRRLTQQSRPTRKASKKALEEMNRETQRMSRNMQLAHQAKTKKKITKDSLLARFNFRTAVTPHAESPQIPSSSTAVSSAPVSDLEDRVEKPSPPTSPVEPDDSASSPSDQITKNGNVLNSAKIHPQEDELPSMLAVMTQPDSCSNKGKGKALDHVDQGSTPGLRGVKNAILRQPMVRIRPPEASMRPEEIDLDSDDDPEVSPTKKARFSKCDVFNRLPASKAQEGRSLQTLRALAHLNSPERSRRGKKATMSVADMQTLLQKRARQQAVAERAAKIEDLKSRGIIVQTAEERQQDQAEVEDLLEKARREGEEIMQKEKRAAKKAKIANGEVDDLPDSSDEDEGYHEGPDDELQVDLSGSEEEEGEEEDDLENLDGSASDAEESANEDNVEGGVSLQDDSRTNALVNDEASQDGDGEHDKNCGTDEDSEDEEGYYEQELRPSRRHKMMVVVDDDDDEDLDGMTQTGFQNEAPAVQVPVFPADSAHFGAAPMGLTQAFAATMADTQTQTCEGNEEQDSLALLGAVPEPDVPMFDTYDTNDSVQVVEDSQNGLQLLETNASRDIELQFSQSQVWRDGSGESQGEDITATQLSEIPDPTQDVGFGLSSPAPERFVLEPPSTVDTVLLPSSAGIGSPIKKRGRLRRRAVAKHDSSDADEDLTTAHNERANADGPTNAFDAMREAPKAAKAAAAAKEAFDKKKSEAKGMVEEQAQESEDEYAGLGGVSDEDSGEEDEDVNAMMDHEDVKVDERRLAQLYADKERASDEKAVEKLYKDINSGMLRRKRGADFDLSDSDDDREAIRKRKQREFAKMRKALLADENVNKIAEDPKKSAFLQTIEDREYDDELDFLNRPAEDSFRVDTGTQEEPDSQSQQPTLPAPVSNNRKQPLQDSVPDRTNMRPPAAARRTAAPKKPATLAEIRESVSFLIEEPGSVPLPPDPSSSASEDEGAPNNINSSHRNPRRTPGNPIIDRLSLKRAESTTTSRLAFHDHSNLSTIGGFKVPSLLRRATTSQLSANGEDKNGISTAAATERAAGGGEKGEFVRMGKGGKRSSVTFGGRERVGRGVVEGVERRRREEVERVARESMARGGLRGLVGGMWE